jgi:hypothetical protein
MAVVFPGKFIYLATIHTGAMATANALKTIDGAFSAYDKRNGIGHLATLDQVKQVCGDQLTGMELVVGGVRNPYDLFVSWMHHSDQHLQVRRWEQANKQTINVRGFLELWLEMNHDPYFRDGRVFHQAKDCKKFIHFENLQVDINSILRKIPEMPSEARLRGMPEMRPRDHWSTFYDDDTYAFVNEHFQQEFVEFGYPFVWSTKQLA